MCLSDKIKLYVSKCTVFTCEIANYKLQISPLKINTTWIDCLKLGFHMGFAGLLSWLSTEHPYRRGLLKVGTGDNDGGADDGTK